MKNLNIFEINLCLFGKISYICNYNIFNDQIELLYIYEDREGIDDQLIKTDLQIICDMSKHKLIFKDPIYVSNFRYQISIFIKNENVFKNIFKNLFCFFK